MVGNKSKKLKVEENFKHNINEELVLSFEKFQEVQDKLEKINEKQCVKFLKIAQKYNEKRKPVYDMRNEITKLIPYFWLTAFMSHPVLYDILNYEDRKMFKYMHSLEVEDNKDVNSDYKINFNFNPNPYFENTKLTKAFTILEDGTKKITASPIKWKEGKGIRSGVDHDKKRNKRFDSSFFRWFSDCKQKDDMHDIHDEVAELIKNELWPNPLSSFNNVSSLSPFFLFFNLLYDIYLSYFQISHIYSFYCCYFSCYIPNDS
uniref:Protein SET n=1 Tax=Cajanus cajan TaxID=3821 RepID=A0A151SL42_CAJCA|nr:Protein SET [Cajanus cajan]